MGGQPGAKSPALWRDPLQSAFGQLVKKPAPEIKARLPVQHAGLRMAQVQTFASARDGNVHQTAFFFQTVVAAQRVFMREQALFNACDKDTIKFEALARMHSHKLDGVLPGLRLVVTRFQRSM